MLIIHQHIPASNCAAGCVEKMAREHACRTSLWYKQKEQDRNESTSQGETDAKNSFPLPDVPQHELFILLQPMKLLLFHINVLFSSVNKVAPAREDRAYRNT